MSWTRCYYCDLVFSSDDDPDCYVRVSDREDRCICDSCRDDECCECPACGQIVLKAHIEGDGTCSCCYDQPEVLA